ncbi:holo-ACP synthase [Leucobacter massiliensis]|uniref:Holo-[acyl-carrier-protein] synthase n=1 Tax=Leucobacter massiliensis TaxID=1686285 RepID=A0A2S9QPH7_9MICO|nr:holo-ACP synthase [Leucobacter massiliensis]PRI11482.1 holo-ACP synthase [Leucobacter massiliensis]
MIMGIGVDTVDIERFTRQLGRTPRLRERLFSAAEAELPAHSLAARFAAKEALIKALGGSGALRWHDMQVVRDRDRAPAFVETPGLAAALAARAADRVHLSMTHDGGVATAFVVVESSGTGRA